MQFLTDKINSIGTWLSGVVLPIITTIVSWFSRIPIEHWAMLTIMAALLLPIGILSLNIYSYMKAGSYIGKNSIRKKQGVFSVISANSHYYLRKNSARMMINWFHLVVFFAAATILYIFQTADINPLYALIAGMLVIAFELYYSSHIKKITEKENLSTLIFLRNTPAFSTLEPGKSRVWDKKAEDEFQKGMQGKFFKRIDVKDGKICFEMLNEHEQITHLENALNK